MSKYINSLTEWFLDNDSHLNSLIKLGLSILLISLGCLLISIAAHAWAYAGIGIR